MKRVAGWGKEAQPSPFPSEIWDLKLIDSKREPHAGLMAGVLIFQNAKNTKGTTHRLCSATILNDSEKSEMMSSP
jgi:hypothetical protein